MTKPAMGVEDLALAATRMSHTPRATVSLAVSTRSALLLPSLERKYYLT